MIDDETINRWRANYGLVERNPIQAAQFWEMTNSGMAPSGAVAALGICLDELAEMHAELAEARRDIEMAAGELMVAMPQPGTDMARVMLANAMMRRERDEARRERDRLREAVEVLQTDVYNLTQKVIPNIRKERDDAEAELAEVRREAERLRDIFRANMLRYVPGVTHEQISAALDGERCFVNPKPIAAIDAARKESP